MKKLKVKNEKVQRFLDQITPGREVIIILVLLAIALGLMWLDHATK